MGRVGRRGGAGTTLSFVFQATFFALVHSTQDDSDHRIEPPLDGDVAHSVVVEASAFSSQLSTVDGPGTIMAVAGNEVEFPAGNTVYIRARDMFGNARKGWLDSFVMDPMMKTPLSARVAFSGDGTYELTFWWNTPLSQVAYELCQGPASDEMAVATMNGCQAQDVPGADRIIHAAQIYVHKPTAAALTDASKTRLTCLTQAAGRSCGSTQAVAGVEASFVIEAMDERGQAQLSGSDTFTAALDGVERVTASVRHLRLNYYECVSLQYALAFKIVT